MCSANHSGGSFLSTLVVIGGFSDKPIDSTLSIFPSVTLTLADSGCGVDEELWVSFFFAGVEYFFCFFSPSRGDGGRRANGLIVTRRMLVFRATLIASTNSAV